jgi:hypothetical protein
MPVLIFFVLLVLVFDNIGVLIAGLMAVAFAIFAATWPLLAVIALVYLLLARG